MGTIFQFKQFAVDQADCAMKINTDGVLLAAQVAPASYTRILDVGTGTGVIALMLAQRFEKAYVDAVEIDPAAAYRAAENFKNSPFKERLKLIAQCFQEFKPSLKYDLIIANPPFYTDSLKNPDLRKTLARHTDLQFFEELLAFVARYGTKDCSLQLILPGALADQVVKLGEGRFFLHATRHISSFEGQEVFRKIIDLRPYAPSAAKDENLVIYQERNCYTEAYKRLLKPYFLAY
ncbi:methyltransferase [Sphingobacteriaceae bacterium WQ 2009]|uniref:tRNA1(Val) (adenine(37)-N6)-methyltransferase n=1 Tax=Rhinopithecimicrobium faecis TaxID=2820698 RepID=A0A8T4HAG1_9SPHI|nr:methyltransferase [Sphingobacteriaceae bacterium WQ 2009]